MCENVLDADNWKVEARAVINDIKNHVKQAALSSKLQSTNQKTYINLTTLEQKDFCVELSKEGFRICGNSHDDISLKNEEYFETPYSLLNKISAEFCDSFGNALLAKLTSLSEQ